MTTAIHPNPTLFVIGAGPGDPDLITLKGHRLLTQADVIFYTGSLVPLELLQACQPEAELIDTRSEILESILPMMLERLRAGQRVVRLQDGDPSLYGALHELMMQLSAHQIDVEIIPGVSAFQLAAARLKTELTIPQLVQTIILTRVSGRTQVPPPEELASLAAHQASLCLYLSARHVAKAQEQLLVHYPADLPIAICYRLGWPEEQILWGPLSEMASLTQSSGWERTVLYMISPALRGRQDLTLAERRSRLYQPSHTHLFRSQSRSQALQS